MSKGHVICLYECSGLSAEAWAFAGYTVYHYDILTIEPREEPHGEGVKVFLPWNADNRAEVEALMLRHRGQAKLVLGFPPCTDLAVSGSRHFAAKLQADPNCQNRAVARAKLVAEIAGQLNVPYCIENPVSILSSLWRKPDFTFHPCNYGGYLPPDDVHPIWPKYIAPRDAYPKKTCYWTGGNFIMPPMRPVSCPPGYSEQHLRLGGKSAKTKSIRSMSPRGIARAIYLANK